MDEVKLQEITVRLLCVMGEEQDIADIASLSHGKDEAANPERLIRKLYTSKPRHTVPFEFPVLRYRLHVPIFVARQLYTYRATVRLEQSRRYTRWDGEVYHPEWFHLIREATEEQEAWDNDGKSAYYDGAMGDAYANYVNLTQAGVPLEEARLAMPVAAMTTFIWQFSLLELLRICDQRIDSHAQSETRWVAMSMLELVKDKFPATVQCFLEEHAPTHS